MTIDPSQIPPHVVYAHLVRAVTPRPIGWVSTISAGGEANLAPYSFFNALSANPAAVMFSATTDRNGKFKDSLLNVREVDEFVCNIVSYELAERMNRTSATLGRGEDEFAFAGLTPAPSERVRPPRCAEAKVHFECRVHQIVPLGEGPLSSHVVIGRVLLMHVADEVLTEGMIDPHKLETVGRMGGSGYCRTREQFSMDRP